MSNNDAPKSIIDLTLEEDEEDGQLSSSAERAAAATLSQASSDTAARGRKRPRPPPIKGPEPEELPSLLSSSSSSLSSYLSAAASQHQTTTTVSKRRKEADMEQEKETIHPKTDDDDDDEVCYIIDDPKKKSPTSSSSSISVEASTEYLVILDSQDNGVVTENVMPALHHLHQAIHQQQQRQQQQPQHWQNPYSSSAAAASIQMDSCFGASGSSVAASLLSQSLSLRHIEQQDKWSCGFRNTQMMLSAVLPRLPARHQYFEGRPQQQQQQPDSFHNNNNNNNNRATATTTTTTTVLIELPSVLQLQHQLQAAWAAGLDPQGAQHYQHQIVHSRRWIGAVEVWTLLAGHYHLDSCVVQFIVCAASRSLLGPFCRAYFVNDSNNGIATLHLAEHLLEQCSSSSTTQQYSPASSLSSLNSSPSIPLYLQWEGHSVLVVGVISSSSNKPTHLVTLDPQLSGAATIQNWNSWQSSPTKSSNRIMGLKSLTELARKDCQIVLAAPQAPQQRPTSVSAVTAAETAVQACLARGAR